MLCEAEWEGGCGYTPQEIGQMTLDQIWFRLCKKEMLKGTAHRTPLTAVETQDRKGLIKGRAEDGTPIKGVIRGKSKAKLIREVNKAHEEALEMLEEERNPGSRRKKRRGRHGS